MQTAAVSRTEGAERQAELEHVRASTRLRHVMTRDGRDVQQASPEQVSDYLNTGRWLPLPAVGEMVDFPGLNDAQGVAVVHIDPTCTEEDSPGLLVEIGYVGHRGAVETLKLPIGSIHFPVITGDVPAGMAPYVDALVGECRKNRAQVRAHQRKLDHLVDAAHEYADDYDLCSAFDEFCLAQGLRTRDRERSARVTMDVSVVVDLERSIPYGEGFDEVREDEELTDMVTHALMNTVGSSGASIAYVEVNGTDWDIHDDD